MIDEAKLAAIVAELEDAVAALHPVPAFLALPEDAVEQAYRRGARDAYEIVLRALKG
jgi:hypothetical protein